MDTKMEEKWIKHYSSQHKILLVGEGDFSFALSLAYAFGSASNMVATSRDSKGSLIKKYSRASIIFEELERLGCSIVHEVDARRIHNHPMLQNKIFDRIIYNFPHAGFGFGGENNLYQIGLHQDVVCGFLKSAKKMLTKDGEVHITHKNNDPFSKWEIVKLADNIGLVFIEKVPFKISDYPCYVNKRGSGQNCDGTFPIGDSSTFKFSKPKYMKPISVGISVVLEDSDSIHLKNYASKNIMLASKMEGKWIKHYSNYQKILLVGEGDFSFALCLANAFGSASNMVATSLDSKESLTVKYSVAWKNLLYLDMFGCTILHEVNALTMDQHPLLLGKRFDRIVFNFPQDVGFAFEKIQNHQKLVLGFLQNAKKMLSCDGEVHVTLNCTFPFNKWEVVKLAEKAGLVLIKKLVCTFKFSKARRVESIVRISEISVDPNSLRLKDASDCELMSSSKDLTDHVSTSANLVETTICSSSNTATKSNSISMCTIL